MLRLNPLFTGLAAFLASVTVMWLAIADENSHIQATTPKKLPPLTYIDEFQKPTSIQPEKYKLTIVHFWATWCEPCITELPELDKFQKRYSSEGVKVFALSMDGKNIKKVNDFMESKTISSLRPALDGDMKSYKTAMVSGLPTSVFINSKGQQIALAEGPIDWDSKEVSEFIAQALK